MPKSEASKGNCGTEDISEKPNSNLAVQNISKLSVLSFSDKENTYSVKRIA